MPLPPVRRPQAAPERARPRAAGAGATGEGAGAAGTTDGASGGTVDGFPASSAFWQAIWGPSNAASAITVIVSRTQIDIRRS